MAVSIGWAGYFDSLLRGLGMELPRWLVTDLRTALGDPALLAAAPHLGPIPIVFNLPALAIVALITWLLVIGTKESARVNTVMVAIKVGIIALFTRSEEHTSELQSRLHLVCRLLLEKKKS